jgi:uncharacterized protein DUF3558
MISNIRILTSAITTALLLAALANCATVPAPTGMAPSQPSTRSLPQRPRDLQLTSIDPCSLITPSLRQQLYNLNTDFDRTKSYDSLISEDCAITNVPTNPGYALGVRLVTSQNTEHFLLFPKTRLTTVDGYGALEQPGLADLTGNRTCLVIVDVAPKQSLWISFGGTDNDLPPGGYEAMCRKAHTAADSVLRQLLARSS